MEVAIFGLNIDPSFSSDLTRFFSLLKERKVKVYIYEPFYKFVRSNCNNQPDVAGTFNTGYDLPDSVSFLISIGGDGTFLKSILSLKRKTIPVVGINLGRLGFLSAISRQEMAEAIDRIIQEEYEIEERSVLQLDFDGVVDLVGDFNYAFNEITVVKADTSSMIKIHTFLNDEYLTTYWADGLIISTPTGSTAYSLSVGGPILSPDSKSMVITPIAPHNLTMRPIVVPDDNKITLKIEGRGLQFLTSLDSRSMPLDFPGEIYIQKADFHVKTLRLPDHSFFSTLRSKLMWGTDQRN